MTSATIDHHHDAPIPGASRDNSLAHPRVRYGPIILEWTRFPVNLQASAGSPEAFLATEPANLFTDQPCTTLERCVTIEG